MTDDALPTVPGYRFEAKMAEGGMGVVYRAVDDTLGRTVAIKMIRSALLGKGDEEEETVARFLREARSAAQIRSNHVAHVLQFGQTDSGDLFLVLEYLDGITLADLLRREKRLSVERAVRITRQICRGMEAAHQLGIVHRDLKPSNVMLVNQDGDPEFAKILDFGVAKVVGERESGVTRAGMLVGTYTCMAPEQVTNETIDARTDVYALAVMLFRLLTGKPLFEGHDVTAVLFHHVHTAAPAPSKVAPEARIPPALDAVVLRALEKDPARRPRSMADFDRMLGLTLEMGETGDALLSQAPTTVTGPNDVTRTSFASREPTAEADDGEVFADSGAIISVVEAEPEPDPAPRSSSGSRPAPAGDPPTPHTSTSSKQRVSLDSLAARTGDSLPTGDPLLTVPESPPVASSRKPLVAAAAGVAVLLVVIGLVALFAGGGAEDDVVVVMSPASAGGGAPTEPSPPQETASAATGEEPSEPAADSDEPDAEAPPTEADGDEKAGEEPAGDETGAASAAGQGSASPAAQKASSTVERPKQPTVMRPLEGRGQRPDAAEQRRRRALRKKAEEPKPPPKAERTEPASDDDNKPRPRFIRVRTGDTDG